MNDRNIGDNNTIEGIVQSLTIEERKNLFAALNVESFGKTLAFSAEGTKSLVYINGGAAVAMLAFCGNYIGEIDRWSIASILCFSAGSLIGVWVLYAAYITQGNFTNLKKERGRAFNICAFVFAFIAMTMFVSGIITSTLAIKNLYHKKITHYGQTNKSSIDKIIDAENLSAEEKIKVLKVLKK